MLSKKLLSELNEQVNREYFSSYLYLAMSTFARSCSLDGFGRWLRVQAQEELGHALRIIDFIEERGGVVTLKAIEQPVVKAKSMLDVFEKALGHEKFVTKCIWDLCALSEKEKDFAAKEFLGWFVKEQVEEESSAQLIVDKLKMIGDSAGSLLYLDKELGKRKEEEED